MKQDHVPQRAEYEGGPSRVGVTIERWEWRACKRTMRRCASTCIPIPHSIMAGSAIALASSACENLRTTITWPRSGAHSMLSHPFPSHPLLSHPNVPHPNPSHSFPPQPSTPYPIPPHPTQPHPTPPHPIPFHPNRMVTASRMVHVYALRCPWCGRCAHV